MTDEYLKARDKAADEELYSQTISDRINGFAARDFFKRGHDAGYTRGKEEASEEIEAERELRKGVCRALEARAQRDEALTRIAALRAALEWYGLLSNWFQNMGVTTTREDHPKGGVAREALSADDEYSKNSECGMKGES